MNSQTQVWAISVILLVTVILTFTHLFLKRGVALLPVLPADSMEAVFVLASGVFHNPYLMSGFILYGISGVLFILALKGGEISVLAPLFSMNFVWVAIVGTVVFGEVMNPLKWAGVASIVIGVSLVGVGGTK